MPENTNKFEFLSKERAKLVEKKQNFHNLFEELGRLEGSHLNSFTGSPSVGEKKNLNIFDSTYSQSSRRYASIVESFLTPRTEKYHFFKFQSEERNKNTNLRKYADAKNNYHFNKRYDPQANFASQFHESLLSFAAFGTGVLYVGKRFDKETKVQIPIYKSVHISQVYIDENYNGVVDRVLREFPMKLSEIAEEFGKDKLPAELVREMEKDPNAVKLVSHRVAPNNEFEKGMFGVKGMKYSSTYFIADKRIILRDDEGFNSFPYLVIRDLTAPNEVWGRGPGINTLPDIKMLNKMVKSLLMATDHSVSPTMLAMQDGVASRPNLAPNSIVRGGIDEQGRPTLQPLNRGGDISFGLEMINQTRRIVQDAFFVTLFQILQDTPRRTATEVLELSREKGALLSPTLGRVQSEALGRLIEREMDIFKDNPDYPETPEELKDEKFKIVFDSPFDRAQRAEEVTAILRTYESILPIAEQNPEVLDNINDDKAVKSIMLNGGAPADITNNEQEIRRIREARNQSQQAQAQAEQQQSASETVKNLAQADNLRNS